MVTETSPLDAILDLSPTALCLVGTFAAGWLYLVFSCLRRVGRFLFRGKEIDPEFCIDDEKKATSRKSHNKKQPPAKTKGKRREASEPDDLPDPALLGDLT
eukprot:CAMPEP_0197855458 /NCGR_PEP_ID=MMETSP1438-20131217/26692_1 /TAXON_ID=1461541 /ORGANISM="Pterosperma sp., Strain CCMP1384" /LENGTH=100 /DNA_ID=CAMNT_0043470575 /DNA_START=37 /DNA_END=335 /DNA_ORIENTATION=+